jgi:hypothetical protein
MRGADFPVLALCLRLTRSRSAHVLSNYDFDKDLAAFQLPAPHTISFRRGKRAVYAPVTLLESARLGRHRDEPPARLNTALRSNLHLYTVLELRGHTHAFMYASMSSPLNP